MTRWGVKVVKGRHSHPNTSCLSGRLKLAPEMTRACSLGANPCAIRERGPVKTFPDLRGRTIAIPSRFFYGRLILFRAMKRHSIQPSEIKMVEMVPPDVAGALAANAIDAFSMGEPFPSQAEMAVSAAFFFAPVSIGRITFRAFWWFGRT